MNTRKNPLGLRRLAVMLLALVLVANICAPGLRVRATEGAPVDQTVPLTTEAPQPSDPVPPSEDPSEPVQLGEDPTDPADPTEGAVADDPVTLPAQGEEADPTDPTEPGQTAVISEAAQAYLDQIAQLKARFEALDQEAEDYANQVEAINRELVALADEFALECEEGLFTEEEMTAVLKAMAELSQAMGGSDTPDEDKRDESASSGNMDHIEIEIDGSASVTIDGKTYTQEVAIYTTDSFTVTATQDGKSFTGFSQGVNSVGNGSTMGETVKIGGTYPTGTYDSPVFYTIKVTKNVTFQLEGDEVLTIPVTLTVKIQYWDFTNNHCPGCSGREDWTNKHNFIRGSGIDVAISGSAVGQAITKGKLAVSKTLLGTSESHAFRFYIQNSEGKYLTFSGNRYTGLAGSPTYITVTSGTKVVLTEIPAGVYRITEVQEDGYIVTDADGNSTGSYSYDYVVENKSDDAIPIANFTNKKLTEEAGISIRKTASGLTGGYPNPTVTIYPADGEGKPTGTALWSGTLTANGDTLYLKTTLPAGTYVVVETGETVEGYTCTATLNGGAAMTFTAAAGSRHDLVVTNTYVEKPKTCDLAVTKTVKGNMGRYDQTFSFTASLTDATFVGVSYTLYTGDVAGETMECSDESTFSFQLKHGQKILFHDLPTEKIFTVTEAESGYVTTVEGNKSRSFTLTLAETNDSIDFINVLDAVIDTGITLDSAPFCLLLSAAVVLAGLTLTGKRRRLE